MLRLRGKRGGLVLAVVLVGLASGCAPGSGNADEVRDSLGQIETILDSTSKLLPSVPIEIGRDGRVERIGGFPAKTVDDLAQRLSGNPLVGRVVVIDEAYLKWFDRANIQHATLAVRPGGLLVWVNGRPLPHVAWDSASLDNLVRVLAKFQKRPEAPDQISLVSPQAYDSIRATLPLVKSLNLRFDVRFPDYPNLGAAKRKPVAPPGAAEVEDAPAAARADRRPLQTVDVEIVYHPLKVGDREMGWVPSLFGFSTVDLQHVADSVARPGGERVKVPQFRLREDIRKRIETEGIASIAFEARSDGLFVTVDGRLLPHFAWSEASLTNLSALLEQLYPSKLKKLPDDARWVPVVRRTAPMYDDYDLGVIVRFPAAVR